MKDRRTGTQGEALLSETTPASSVPTLHAQRGSDTGDLVRKGNLTEHV